MKGSPDKKPAVWVFSANPDFVEGVRSSLLEAGVEAEVLTSTGTALKEVHAVAGELPYVVFVDTSTVNMEIFQDLEQKDFLVLPLSKPDPASIWILFAASRNYQELRERLTASAQSLASLNTVVRALNRPLSDAQVLPAAIQEISLIFNCRHLVMLSPEGDNYSWRVLHHHGVPDHVLQTLNSPQGRSTLELVSYQTGSGEISGTVHVIRDVTEEKAITRLEEEKRQLEELDHLKNRFMASVTHELKTPLNAIIGFSELLMSGTYGEINENQRNYLENIYVSGKHLLSLISDILDYMQVQAGGLFLHLEDLETRPFLASTLELMRQEAVRRGVEISLEMENAPSRIIADRRRLRQVILNLLSNALKFTPSGGNVLLRAGSSDGGLLIEVKDTGVGIKPEDQDKLFQEFVQVGEGTRAAGGTGLGLALSKQLVELHGGHIWFTSEPGKGSTFSFTLPPRPPGIPGEDDFPDSQGR